MNLNTALGEIECLRVALQDQRTAFRYEVFSSSEPFKVWCDTWHKTLFGGQSVSAPEVTSRYGVYLLATVDTEIIYVGKAAPQIRRAISSKNAPRYHLGAEIWNKMRAPSEVNETKIFESGPLVKKVSLSNGVRQALRLGEILISAIEIEPWELAACIESYLQAFALLTDEKLPVANDRIG